MSEVKQINYEQLARERAETTAEIERMERDDYILNFTDAAALARAEGLLDATTELRLALLEGECPADRPTSTRWSIKRGNFRHWLDSALVVQSLRTNDCIELSEARARARERGVKKASDRLIAALKDGEVKNAELVGVRWMIPRDQFEVWLESQLADAQELSDSTVSLGEAVALAGASGLRGMRGYILEDCINRNIEGAYRDGATWRMPYASIEAWIDGVIALIPNEQEAERPHWLLLIPWHHILWVVTGIVFWVLLSRDIN
jgi:hypothetical protein